MDNLQSLQKSFFNALEKGESLEGLKPSAHLEVYQNAYRIRLKDSLEEDFPKTLKLVTTADMILDQYLKAHPSRSWTLAEFAKDFPTFLEKSFPKRPEVFIQAKIEWAEWLAFQIGCPEEDASIHDGQTFALDINPSLQMIESQKLILIYEFKGHIRQKDVEPKWGNLLRLSLEKKAFDKICESLSLEESEIVQMISELSKEGIIRGTTNPST